MRPWIVVLAGAALLPAFSAVAGELVKFKVHGGNEIRESLTGKPGDPEAGRRIALDRGLGNCLACHVTPIEGEMQGNVGPELNGVAGRLTEPEIRLRVVDARILNPQTAMPAYYRVDGLYKVRKDLAGKPILSAEQIEDVVAYLMTLKE